MWVEVGARVVGLAISSRLQAKIQEEVILQQEEQLMVLFE